MKVVTDEYSGGRTSVKLLVFQHIECEHPGIFRTLLDEAEIQWDAVELDAGERIPDF